MLLNSLVLQEPTEVLFLQLLKLIVFLAQQDSSALKELLILFLVHLDLTAHQVQEILFNLCAPEELIQETQMQEEVD